MDLLPIAVGIFNAILKDNNCDIEIFDTRLYGRNVDHKNKHMQLAEAGAVKAVKSDKVALFNKNQKDMSSDFISLVEQFNPDIMLVPIMEDVWTITKMLLDDIKHFNIPTMAGGVFVMAQPELVLQNENIDAVCIYEGEEVVKNLVKEKRFDNLNGVWYKDSNGNIIKNQPYPLCNISEITPDFDCFDARLTQRPMGGRLFKRVLTMETFRGCPYNCAYCGSPGIKKHSKEYNLGPFNRRKSIDVIERDLHFYKKSFDPDLIMFQDDSFLARPKHELLDMAKMLAKFNIPFWFNTRIENCELDVLLALKEAGCYRMTFGIESGDEEYRMKFLHRNVTNATYDRYFEFINESNIPYSLNAIIGFPFETREMVLETARLFHRAAGYDGMTIAKYQVYCDTELREIAVENNFISPDHLNSEFLTDLSGGTLGGWDIKMPAPYLQPHDVEQLVKCFALYAYYPEDMWIKILAAETNPELYHKLITQYKQEFFTEFQRGGKDIIASRRS